MGLPILYSFRRCPYAMRARLAVASSELQCALREVVLRNKPEALLEASPKGTVPVLVTGTQVVDESIDIMQWALSQSDPESLLTPQKGDLAQMLALIAENDGLFKQALDRYKYPQRHAEHSEAGGADDYAAIHRDEGAKWLQQLEQRLAQDRYLFGVQLSLADIAIAPFVRQYAHTDLDWFNEQPWPNLIGWFNEFVASARFLRVMEKYEPWEPQQAKIIFPPPQL